MDAVSKFEAAEKRVMDYYGLEYESRFVELSEPRMRARVIEVGAGEPVLLVASGRSAHGGRTATVGGPL